MRETDNNGDRQRQKERELGGERETETERWKHIGKDTDGDT